MKMALLNVCLIVCLLMSLVTSLRAQAVSIDSWVQADPASGSWQAGGDTDIYGDAACDFCGTELSVTTTVSENGVRVAQVADSGIFDTASAYYDSPTIVNLNGSYDASSRHDIYWNDAPTETDYTETSITIPGIPYISLNGIDASRPPFAQWSFNTVPNGFQSLYSSTLVIGPPDIGGGSLAAISYSEENPTFTFDQSQYPGLCCEPVTIPVTFQGYLAGHFFGGPVANVTVWLGDTVTDYTTSGLPEGTEITGGIPTVLATTHTAAENFDLYTYPPFRLFASVVRHK